jgi:hypothetical protein
MRCNGMVSIAPTILENFGTLKFTMYGWWDLFINPIWSYNFLLKLPSLSFLPSEGQNNGMDKYVL